MNWRPAIRLSVLGWGVALVVLVVHLAGRASTFARIFLADSRPGIRLTQDEAAAAHAAAAGRNDTRPQLIPKIIHQVFHNWHDPGNDTLPEDWVQVRQTCVKANPDYEHKLWTEKTSREFLEREYAWFLETYDAYPHKVQRVDAVRYFLLLHYGGIYLDLDNGCMANLDALLYYPMWITDPGRGALSNNVLASRPHHPFWAMLTQALRPWAFNYVFPYVTISYASGQWFVSALWAQYHAMLPAPAPAPGHDHRLHRLLMDDRDGLDHWVFFTQERGGTWKNWDNYLFLWIGDHLLLFLACLLGGPALAAWLGLRAVRRYRAAHGYARLKAQPARYEI